MQGKCSCISSLNIRSIQNSDIRSSVFRTLVVKRMNGFVHCATLCIGDIATSTTHLCHASYPFPGIFIYSEKKYDDIQTVDMVVTLCCAGL